MPAWRSDNNPFHRQTESIGYAAGILRGLLYALGLIEVSILHLLDHCSNLLSNSCHPVYRWTFVDLAEIEGGGMTCQINQPRRGSEGP
jgi:hypothetical protein